MTPSTFSGRDHAFMAEALRVAEGGMFIATPNPYVGCVLVRDDQIIGRGHSQAAGGHHAEVQALADCRNQGLSPKGATAYVTLEPCAHFGRTPPCAAALIEAGVSRVVAALQDPFPQVAGRGLAMLQQAGIATELGLLAAEARELHRGFLSRIERNRPWLRLKLAASLDGKTALANGESKWITGDAARADVQRWRARSCAMLTGIGTVLADDPQLTVREIDGRPWLGRQPWRVILDSQLRTPLSAKLFDGGKLLFVHANAAPERQQAFLDLGAELLALPNADQHIDLEALLPKLAQRGLNEVTVEAGATLAGALLQSRLVDEIVLYQAPVLLGGAARNLADFDLHQLNEKIAPRVVDVRQIGTDWRWLLRC